MKSVLLTAFEPYGSWPTNASGLCLEQLGRWMPPGLHVETRTYPVDFAAVRGLVADDLQAGYDFAILLGQAPRAALIQLESIALNVGGEPDQPGEHYAPLEEVGPLAYRSDLPLGDWSQQLRQAGIPAKISHHAGTYLCNAMLYWSLHLAERRGLRTRSAFVHLPLDPSQAAFPDAPSLPSAKSAQALRIILESLAGL